MDKKIMIWPNHFGIRFHIPSICVAYFSLQRIPSTIGLYPFASFSPMVSFFSSIGLKLLYVIVAHQQKSNKFSISLRSNTTLSIEHHTKHIVTREYCQKSSTKQLGRAKTATKILYEFECHDQLINTRAQSIDL